MAIPLMKQYLSYVGECDADEHNPIENILNALSGANQITYRCK